MRKIELTLSDAFTDATNDTPPTAVNAAIGRLASWAIQNERYKNVVIVGSKEGCLYGTYRNEAGEVTYSLYAQLDESRKSYSFHS